MNPVNPYQAPDADTESPASGDVAELRLFSPKGRIGRMRFIAWTVGLILVLALMGLLAGLAGSLLGIRSEAFSVFIAIVSYLPPAILNVIWAIQRSHDFNASGWLAILVLVPLANLIFWVIPGTQGENRFGPPPPANSLGVKILFSLVMIVLVLGVMGVVVAFLGV